MDVKVICNPTKNRPMGNYYHFLLEYVLKLYHFMYSNKLLDVKTNLYVKYNRPEQFKKYHHILNEIFKNSNFIYNDESPRNPLVLWNANERYRSFWKKEFNKSVDDLVERITSKELEGKYLILIERENESSNKEFSRMLSNHYKLENALRRKYAEEIGLDFKNLRLSELKFSEQVGYFSNARVVVGQHGAGLSNVVWMKANTKVIEIEHLFNGVSRDSFVHPCMYNDVKRILSKPLEPNVADIDGIIQILREIND